MSMALYLDIFKLVFYVNIFYLCRYFLSFVPSVRMFPLLIIQFVPFRKITDSMKVWVQHNNTVCLNIKIKRILMCKICYHSKYTVVWIWIWSKNEKFGSNSSADTLVSNALKLFMYYLFDQQIRFCMFCHLEKDVSDLKMYKKKLFVCVCKFSVIEFINSLIKSWFNKRFVHVCFIITSWFYIYICWCNISRVCNNIIKCNEPIDC